MHSVSAHGPSLSPHPHSARVQGDGRSDGEAKGTARKAEEHVTFHLTRIHGFIVDRITSAERTPTVRRGCHDYGFPYILCAQRSFASKGLLRHTTMILGLMN